MRNALLCAAGVLVLGCAGGGSGTAAQPGTGATPRVTRGTSNLITESEIAATAYQNALDIVQNLRPAMLIPRGVGSDATGTTTTSIPIIVYMDDVRLGEPSSMVNVPASRIKEIRFMNARDATTRWGTGHSSGVILVTTKR